MRNKYAISILALLAMLGYSLLLGRHPAYAQTDTGTPPATVVVLTSTRMADGSVIHEVEPGQALWSIANAYGLSVDNLKEYNYLPTDVVLYAGDKLVIEPSYTPTASPTITNTPLPPTRTPLPTRTPRPATLTPTQAPSLTATQPPLIPELPVLQGNTRRSMGIGLIILCAIGILAVVLHSIRNK